MMPKERALNIGVMGYVNGKYDRAAAEAFIKDGYDKIEQMYPDRAKVVISGVTDGGILHQAYSEAERRGYGIKGVACEKIKDYPMYPGLKDEDIKLVGKAWGDESSTFLKDSDIFLRVGGGPQTMREVAEAKKIGKTAIEYDLERE